jgi:hypothetical protein
MSGPAFATVNIPNPQYYSFFAPIVLELVPRTSSSTMGERLREGKPSAQARISLHSATPELLQLLNFLFLSLGRSRVNNLRNFLALIHKGQ